MIRIRQGTFETNSSSTHSIVFSKAPIDLSKLPEYQIFQVGNYQWEVEEYKQDAADYLYTIIQCALEHLKYYPDDSSYYKYKDACERLSNILAKYGVKAIFVPVKADSLSFGIDHSDEALPFLDWMLSDEDALIRYLFGDTVIYTGNDNEDREEGVVPKYFAAKTLHEWVRDPNGTKPYHGHFEEVKNPWQDDEHEYYYKTN